jgi:hypothetical protein
MKFCWFNLILILTLSVCAFGQEPVSRFGKLRIVVNEDTKHKLLLNEKGLFYYEGHALEIFKVFNGKDRDYVIVVANSGGIACPAKVVIIELFKSGEPRQSEMFGSCSDEINARFINGKVIVETPMYAAHPEQLSKTELKRRESSKEVYIWFQSRLSKSIKPR